MNIYTETEQFLLQLPILNRWTEMRTLIERAVKRQPRDWELPVMACQAMGGTASQALAGVAAIACMQISIILIDDMLDSDPRGVYHELGYAKTANLAAAFQSAAIDAVSRSQLNPAAKMAAIQSVNQMAFTTSLGQHHDVQNSSSEIEYWETTRLKSAPFFGAALYVRALLGGSEPHTAGQLQRLGNIYGEMIQIHDDLKDTLSTPASPDWLEERSPLPILFAQSVPHPQRDRFLELKQHLPSTPQALEEAQTILIRCGAISYCIDQLLYRHQLARELLTHTSLLYRDEIEQWLASQLTPVQEIFETVGVEIMLGGNGKIKTYVE